MNITNQIATAINIAYVEFLEILFLSLLTNTLFLSGIILSSDNDLNDCIENIANPFIPVNAEIEIITRKITDIHFCPPNILFNTAGILKPIPTSPIHTNIIATEI
jgi:hypothetical protein